VSAKPENPWPVRLRRAIDSEQGFDPLGIAYRRARYLYAHR
jgi:hypothetical protein